MLTIMILSYDGDLDQAHIRTPFPLQPSSVQCHVTLAHCYAIFLCSSDVEIDDSLVGQLTII